MNFTTISILISLCGILILYFGKIILKARKELAEDIIYEWIEGWKFFFLYFITAIVINTLAIAVLSLRDPNIKKIFILSKHILNIEILHNGWIFLSFLFIIISIVFYVSQHKKICNSMYDIIKIILSIFLLFLVYTTFMYGYIFGILFFIYYIHIFSNIAYNTNDISKELTINLGQSPFKAKILMTGKEFIKIKKPEEPNKIFTINKSNIISIENVEKKEETINKNKNFKEYLYNLLYFKCPEIILDKNYIKNTLEDSWIYIKNFLAKLTKKKTTKTLKHQRL